MNQPRKKAKKKAKKKAYNRRLDRQQGEGAHREDPLVKPKLKPLRILAQVEDTDEINEILKSAEAKLYLTGIDRSMAKLRAMIDRELRLRRHPSHAEHDPPT